MIKDEIVDRLEDEREKFLDAIEGLSPQALQEPMAPGEWSVKDIIAHLSACEAELVKLLWQLKSGQKPTSMLLGEPDIDAQNKLWHEAFQSRSLELVMSDFEGVRKQTSRRIEAFTDLELDDPKLYPSLGNSPLWKWIAGNSFQHEAEHCETILNWRGLQEQVAD